MFCNTVSVTAQHQNNTPSSLQQSLEWAEQSLSATIHLTPQQSLPSSPDRLVREQIPHLNRSGSELKLKYTKSGKMGTRYQYEQWFHELPVWGAFVAVNILPDNSVFIQDHSFDLTNVTTTTKHADATHWLLSQNQLVPLRKTQDGYIENLTESGGTNIRERDTRLYLHIEDTMVSGKVFTPDPLSSAGVIYGQSNTWKHYNDSDYALINNQRGTVSFPATYVSDSFALINAYVMIHDFAAPFTSGKKSKLPDFSYTRKQQGFKDVMALYHIYNTQQYLQYLGHNLVQYPLRTDPSAGMGDQSYFTYDPDTTLNFGLGGVPDAEDADVIVHEYTHAISWDINPCDNMSVERRSIEEGVCDVMAAVRSKHYTDFNWRRIFNFDAPNPITAGNTAFWAGRNANSTKTYDDYSTDAYKNSEIWSSCMLDIAVSIGTDTLVDVLLSSLLLSTNVTTMPQACQHLLTTDSILYDGRHKLTMGYFFNQRKFGDFPVGGVSNLKSPKPYEFVNSYGFATENEELTIRLRNTSAFHVQVMDITGRVWLNKSGNYQQYSIQPNELPEGLYLIRLTQEGQVWTEKISKFK